MEFLIFSETSVNVCQNRAESVRLHVSSSNLAQCRLQRGIAQTILSLGTRWGWKETRYPLCRRLGGPQGRCGLVRNMSPPPGFFPFRPLLSLSFTFYTFRARSFCPYLFLLSVLYNTQHKHPCCRRDSNPQSHEARDHRPTPFPRGHWALNPVASRCTDLAVSANTLFR